MQYRQAMIDEIADNLSSQMNQRHRPGCRLAGFHGQILKQYVVMKSVRERRKSWGRKTCQPELLGVHFWVHVDIQHRTVKMKVIRRPDNWAWLKKFVREAKPVNANVSFIVSANSRPWSLRFRVELIGALQTICTGAFISCYLFRPNSVQVGQFELRYEATANRTVV
jgi:hypothetical protein